MMSTPQHEGLANTKNSIAQKQDKRTIIYVDLKQEGTGNSKQKQLQHVANERVSM